ncbi:hypothetical protein OG873_39175 [Streptomyces violaceus]|nr:hypothetical protein [Streptomyces violaceus]
MAQCGVGVGAGANGQDGGGAVPVEAVGIGSDRPAEDNAWKDRLRAGVDDRADGLARVGTGVNFALGREAEVRRGQVAVEVGELSDQSVCVESGAVAPMRRSGLTILMSGADFALTAVV